MTNKNLFLKNPNNYPRHTLTNNLQLQNSKPTQHRAGHIPAHFLRHRTGTLLTGHPEGTVLCCEAPFQSLASGGETRCEAREPNQTHRIPASAIGAPVSGAARTARNKLGKQISRVFSGRGEGEKCDFLSRSRVAALWKLPMISL